MPDPMGAQLLAALGQLEQSQWWPKERIEAFQRRQLKALIQHARENVPWYRDNWANLPSSESLVEDACAWHALPLLERGTIQANEQTLISERLPRNHGSLAIQRTSGTTGEPLSVRSTAVTRFLWLVYGLRYHRWQGRDESRRLAFTRLRSDSSEPLIQKRPVWGRPVGMLYKTGPALQLDPRAPVDEQLRHLTAFRPAYLNLYPSVLWELMLLADKKGVRLPHVRGIYTYAEPVDPDLRELCRQVWGVKISDFYSTRELGAVAMQCPQSGLYHIQAENLLVEVLDESGAPCGPGETGDVVVTPLSSFGMPLIRYRLGDRAEVGEPCPCGRGLPTLARITGRTLNLFIAPDGRRIMPHISIQLWRSILPVRQGQLAQVSPDTVEVRIAMDRAPTPEEEVALKQLVLKEMLGYPYRIEIKRFNELERLPSGKFEAMVCEFAADCQNI